MAVVFISPKQRQKVFFMGITIMFLSFLVFIALWVFLSGPKDVSPVLVFNKPKVNINMDIFSSEQFRNLQPIAGIETQYSYTATTKDRKTKTGFISSTSMSQAQATLESSGLTVVDLKESEMGRGNPFSPYYNLVITPGTLNTTPKK